ncbi:MAG: ArsR family transcriptional regulator [Archaeoglobaceae archaeon]|nr:ArsR family transcriptional regulator [Archaeoglobaceae archaeon]MDW8127706.1 ArsR family transcriptional regulator [Archaeoglobaceae archaeon]
MLSRLFLHEKTVEILLNILEAEERGEKVYPLQISNILNSPYSHISRVIGEFEKNSIIESKLEGRTRILRLTEYGRKVAIMLRELKNELSKDFVSLMKLKKLEEIYEKSKRDFYSLAPIIAEIEILLSSTKDENAIREAMRLKKLLESDVVC